MMGCCVSVQRNGGMLCFSENGKVACCVSMRRNDEMLCFIVKE